MENFQVVRLDGTALVRAGRPLAGGAAAELYRVLQGLQDDGAATVVMDLSDVSGVDEGAAAVLSAAAAQIAHLRRAFVLCLPGLAPELVATAGQLRSLLHRVYPSAA